jgi:hypothetical protein
MMKTPLVITLLIVFGLVNLASAQQTITISLGNKTAPGNVEGRQKREKEVAVSTSNIMGKEFYTAVIYRTDNGELKSYRANVEADAVYDRASYKWPNDSTAVIKLFNKKTNKSLTFAVTGSGSSTTLITY